MGASVNLKTPKPFLVLEFLQAEELRDMPLTICGN